MKKIYFYVGSNNKTRLLEVEKIKQVISKYFDGFTAFEVVGYWKGHEEKTLKVEVITDEGSSIVARVASELKQELQQDAILVEVLESNCIYI